MRPITLTTALIAVAGICLAPSSPARGDELQPGVHALRGIHAGLPNDDLEPFKEIVGDASVVALGESVHTSGGFSRMKYRVFRYMVEEMGFRAMAFESSWQYAQTVSDYVATCAGEPERALRGLYPVWQNASVRDMVKWMCAWNRRHPDDPVYFLGMDEQQPKLDYQALRKHLKRFGLPDNDPRIRGLESCSRSRFELSLEPADYRKCVRNLDRLGRWLDRREPALARRTSPEEVEYARVRLVGLRAWQDHWTDTLEPRERFVSRDAAMAYIFLKLRELEYPGVKTAIWAANFHIDKWNAHDGDFPVMGDHLDAALGDDYAAFAFVGYRVEMDFPGVWCGPIVLPTNPDSVEVMLHELGERYVLAEFAHPGEAPLSVLEHPDTVTPFFDPHRKYFLMGGEMFLHEHYDGAFYFEHSPRMVPLAWEPCE